MMFRVFSFHRLHEYETSFKPRLSAFELQHLLYNLTALKISNAGGHNCKCALLFVTQQFMCVTKYVVFFLPKRCLLFIYI